MPAARTDSEIAQAIFTVNRHAKTAPDNQYLYALKKEALQKMVLQNRARKVGLHFSKNPRKSQQQSSVLIQCGEYYFHLLPKKEDFKELEHLGELDSSYRNPPSRMNLRNAKTILAEYTGLRPKAKENKSADKRHQPYTPPRSNRFYSDKKSYFD